MAYLQTFLRGLDGGVDVHQRPQALALYVANLEYFFLKKSLGFSLILIFESAGVHLYLRHAAPASQGEYRQYRKRLELHFKFYTPHSFPAEWSVSLSTAALIWRETKPQDFVVNNCIASLPPLSENWHIREVNTFRSKKTTPGLHWYVQLIDSESESMTSFPYAK